MSNEQPSKQFDLNVIECDYNKRSLYRDVMGGGGGGANMKGKGEDMSKIIEPPHGIAVK